MSDKFTIKLARLMVKAKQLALAGNDSGGERIIKRMSRLLHRKLGDELDPELLALIGKEYRSRVEQDLDRHDDDERRGKLWTKVKVAFLEEICRQSVSGLEA